MSDSEFPDGPQRSAGDRSNEPGGHFQDGGFQHPLPYPPQFGQAPPEGQYPQQQWPQQQSSQQQWPQQQWPQQQWPQQQWPQGQWPQQQGPQRQWPQQQPPQQQWPQQQNGGQHGGYQPYGAQWDQPQGYPGADTRRAGSSGRGWVIVAVILILIATGVGYLVVSGRASSLLAGTQQVGASPGGVSPAGEADGPPAGGTDSGGQPGVVTCSPVIGDTSGAMECASGSKSPAPAPDCSKLERPGSLLSWWKCGSRPPNSIICNKNNDFCMYVSPGMPLPDDVDSNGRSLAHPGRLGGN